MSNIVLDIEHKLKETISSIDIQDLARKAQLASYVHDQIVPMINEVVVSAANSETYEAAYKTVIDQLRTMHETITNSKIRAEQILMTTKGRLDTSQEILDAITSEADAIRAAVKQERVADIADRIQSGSFDPDAPRKIGNRPESIKNIREAKRTLFGDPSPIEEQD